MLYEASPMSFLTSHATTDTQVIIGLVPKSRCLVFLGSKEDVKDLMKCDKGYMARRGGKPTALMRACWAYWAC